jgi:imidazole glycerol-phosphate synthase subunit HisH
MNAVVIVDYGMCNLDSVARAVEECGGKARLTDDPRELKHATHIILPGVGAFAEAMLNLARTGFDQAIVEQVKVGEIPLLGICLGMQLLATRGFEGGETAGLNLIPGEVHRIRATAQMERIPHIGWNEVVPRIESPLLAGVVPGMDFYFVHSYHFVCADQFVLATTPYAGGLVSVVGTGNVFGTQFHPEKSQRAGFSVLRNFLSFQGDRRC